ncbi:recombinase RecF [Candidatus Poribacteria bacterium]|nr:MAG: recombinase RecF [Candidatus Poribacteria bacterium]
MLKRIRIKGYKSLVDLELKLEALTVLVGPNASGKSNFLDALQLLSRIATCQSLEHVFEPPYRGHPLESFTFGDEGIRSLLDKEKISFLIEVDVELSQSVINSVNKRIQDIKDTNDKDQQFSDSSVSKPTQPVRENLLRYRIEIEMYPKKGILRVSDEYLAALSTQGIPKNNRKPFLERIGNRLHLRMEGQSHPLYYERYLDFSILSRSHYPPHYPHLTAMQEELANWLTFYLEPREQMRMPNPVKAAHDIGPMGENLAAFLNNLKAHNIDQFQSIEKSLNKMIPSFTGINVNVNEIGEVELDLKEGTKHFSARVLSEGTLRIIGLLTLVSGKEPPTLIGIEEPENGIHPRRIKRIAKFLEARMILKDIQFIVTTHSSVLPDLIPTESLFICRKDQDNTEIIPYQMAMHGDLFKSSEIEIVMTEHNRLSPSERILRGDFDD